MHTDEGMTRDSARAEFPYGIYAVLATVMILLLFFIMGTALQRFLGISLDNPNMILLQACVQIAGLLIPTVLLMKRSPQGIAGMMRAGMLRWEMRHVIILIGILVLTLACETAVNDIQLYVLPDGLIAWMTRMSEEHDVSMKALLELRSMWSIPLQMTAIAVIPAVTEEMLFRGLFQRSLEQVLSPALAVAMSTILFSFVHFQPTTFLPMLILSTVLGMLAVQTKSLVPGMILHGLSNAVMLALYHSGMSTLATNIPLMPAVFSITIFVLSGMTLRFLVSKWKS